MYCVMNDDTCHKKLVSIKYIQLNIPHLEIASCKWRGCLFRNTPKPYNTSLNHANLKTSSQCAHACSRIECQFLAKFSPLDPAVANVF